MDIREMRYFIELARTKNMTKAAQNLYISQPALHKALRKVEAELDTTLFCRQGNEFLPTDTGTILLEKAQSVLGLVAQMEDSIAATKNLKLGKVHIGFPSVVGSMYLPEFPSIRQKLAAQRSPTWLLKGKSIWLLSCAPSTQML